MAKTVLSSEDLKKLMSAYNKYKTFSAAVQKSGLGLSLPVGTRIIKENLETFKTEEKLSSIEKNDTINIDIEPKAINIEGIKNFWNKSEGWKKEYGE